MNFLKFTLVFLFLYWVYTYPVAAQNSKNIYKVGYLSAATAERDKKQLDAFEIGLKNLGHIVGKNIFIEKRFAKGQYKKLPNLAKELVDLNVDVIVAVGPTSSFAMKATKKIPIVMRQADPVGTGLVSSLSRPGGNVTGMSTYNAELITKRLELLKEIVPSATRIAVLHYPRPKSSHPRQLRDLEKVAPILGITLVPVGIKGAFDLDRTLSEIGAAQTQGLIVLPAALFET
ncbi:MAG: ABC transporter substrate-binding protein, partial [Desulfobulbia bacterium]